MRWLAGLAPLLVSLAAHPATDDAITSPLTDRPGDAARGRAIVANRQVGLCLLCHTGPIAEERFQGNLAPGLAGAGARWSPGQLRLRLVDSRRLNPETIMPAYYRREGRVRVGAPWQGKTLLDAQQIEDVVAYLMTLTTPTASGPSEAPTPMPTPMPSAAPAR